MFNSILLPVDDSARSLKPAEPVIRLARATGAKIIVLSVAERRLYRASDRDSRKAGTEVEAINLSRAESYARNTCEAATKAGVDCDCVVALSAAPEEEIVEASRRFNCDLIAMATRGKMGVIDTLFSESTTLQVLQLSRIPVLVFP
jgi:nucleotide-binding universal stress UspA family protein